MRFHLILPALLLAMLLPAFSQTAPSVTLQPVETAVIKGAPITLVAAGTGSPAPSWQWYRNGSAIPGAVSPTLSISAATLPDHGSYFARLTNASGSLDTATVAVSVLYPRDGLRHRYSFTGNLNDSIGTAHATGMNGAASGAGSISFTQASSHYLRLPATGAGTAGLNLNTYTQLTLEFWCTIAEHNNKLKLFEFGDGTLNTSSTRYLYFAPRTTNTGSAMAQVGFSDNGTSAERIASRSPRMTNVTNAHIVCVFDPVTNTETIYLNGAVAATSSGFSAGALPPLSALGTAHALIGRSIFPSTTTGSGSNFAHLSGSIDEMRIYRVAMRPQDVGANFASGPGTLPALPTAISFASHPQPVTVTDPETATFSVDVNGPKPLAVQWYKNGALIPGATSTTYATSTFPADSGSTYFCRATSGALTLDSSPATLTVNADNVRPVISGMVNSGPNSVLVKFSEPVTSATATNLANYSSATLTFTNAVLGGDSRTVTLTTAAALVPGTSHTLTLSGVADTSFAANLILPGTTRGFTAVPLILGSIGTPNVAPAADSSANGTYTLRSSGSLPRASADQYGFSSEVLTGDFDVRVRVASLGLADLWSSAGLMARNGTAAGDLLAAAVATPGPAGCFFMARTSAGAAPALSGSYPVNYPQTWLRLRREGNVFTGFASIDGTAWSLLSSATVAMNETVQVGLFTSSGTPAETAAAFSDYGQTTGAVAATRPLPFEPDGPSSRRSAITITEISYNPNAVNGTGNQEFIEIHNTAGWDEDLSGWTLKGGLEYTFPEGTGIPAGGYLIVAAAPADLENVTGLTEVLGPWAGALSNSGEAFRLENEVGGTIAEVDYSDQAPWPAEADGLGHTLVLARPSYGENDARAWAASDALGGSPGRRDPWSSSPVRNVRVSEFLTNSASPVTDFVELFNTSTQPVDVGGCRIGSGTALAAGHTLPSPTIIPARGYLSLTQSQLGFALAPDSGRLWLLQPGVRVADAIAYGGQDVNVSRDHEFRELASPTPGTANSDPAGRPVVISEIMYNPLSGNQDEEYIELYNRSAGAVDVSGWRLGSGIDFTIPAGTSITAGGYLVIAKNQAVLLAKGYPSLSAANVRGNFTGSLGNSGESITLSLPISGLAAFATVDEVAYRTGGEWGAWTDGGGSSLELRDARADNSLASNWGDSDESAKAAWTTLTVTMPHDYKMPANSGGGATDYSMANRVEFFLQGAGKCLVDDIEFRDGANLNYVTNGGFESGLGGGLFAWTGQGDQEQISILASGAASGSNCLLLVSSDRGDTGANRVRNALSTDGTNVATLPADVPFTVRAKVRWMAGSRYFHLRSRGNGLELPGVLDIPSTPGTPGAANSIAADAGPAMAGVTHWPILPAAGEAVVVTARLSDPDGINTASLLYRVDPATGFTATAMNDAGAGGDAFASDGVWSATIPGQASGELVAWKIQVTDSGGAPASVYPTPDPLIFPANLQSRECYVRFGETPQAGNLGTYRLWLTAATIAEWNTREKNSNQPLTGTFVLGNHRVYHGIRTLYSGSPFHTGNFNGPTGTGGGGSQCDYEVNFSDDDLFLGTGDVVLQNSTGTCQDEFTAFWIARKLGLFAPNRRPVNLYVNGSRKGTVFEDAEQPSGASIEQYQRSAGEGTLFKVEDWFEFDDGGASSNYFNANLPQTSTTVNGVSNQKKMARYRWNWRIRSQDDPNTYQPIYTLTDLMTAPINAGFVPNLEAQVDLHSWLGSIMAHHIVGNRDTYGYERGKNAYVYKAVDDRWKAYLYDMDFSLAAAQDSATSNLFIANPSATASKDGQPETAKLFGIPGTKRICWEVLQEAAAGPLSGIATPMIDQRYADFQANGVNASAPTATKQYIADRRAYILSQLPSASFGVASSTPNGANLTLTGTAPVSVSEIAINGVEWQVIWTSDTQWSLVYPMQPGLNTLNLTGISREGTVVATTPPVTATYNGSTNWAAARINEWMSDNESIAADPADGLFDDWFEIHNPTAQVLDLTGWHLSDNPAQPNKFVVPAGFTIPANGFIRVWADGTTAQTAAGQLHANFSLSKDGEWLLLSAPDLELIDSVKFDAQAGDQTNGRYPDGAVAIHQLTEATPAGKNIAILWEYITMTPAGSEFRFTTTPGRTYRIHQSTDLDLWTPLGTDQPATGSTLTIIDAEALTIPSRFYRVEIRP